MAIGTLPTISAYLQRDVQFAFQVPSWGATNRGQWVEQSFILRCTQWQVTSVDLLWRTAYATTELINPTTYCAVNQSKDSPLLGVTVTTVQDRLIPGYPLGPGNTVGTVATSGPQATQGAYAPAPGYYTGRYVAQQMFGAVIASHHSVRLYHWTAGGICQPNNIEYLTYTYELGPLNIGGLKMSPLGNVFQNYGYWWTHDFPAPI